MSEFAVFCVLSKRAVITSSRTDLINAVDLEITNYFCGNLILIKLVLPNYLTANRTLITTFKPLQYTLIAKGMPAFCSKRFIENIRAYGTIQMLANLGWFDKSTFEFDFIVEINFFINFCLFLLLLLLLFILFWWFHDGFLE